MEISKGLKRIIDLTRNSLTYEFKSKQYHKGIRFYSDKLVMEKVKSGKSIKDSLRELAHEDYKSL